MNDHDLRDCFALMLTIGFAVKGEINPKAIWEIADMLVEAKDQDPVAGLPAIKRKGRPRNASRVD